MEQGGGIMFWVLRRRHLLLVLLALAAAALALLFFRRGGKAPSYRAAGAPAGRQAAVTLVIDPGHGGEDGGAVAADGTVESLLNLEVALRLREVFRFLGWEPVMTRESDVSIYSEGAATLREKKVSDIRNRVALVNSYAAAVLLSIHQNSLPQAKSVHGAQVFFNRRGNGEDLAAAIQDCLNSSVNQGSAKASKAIDTSVYLMEHIQCPGVLVECGFLSNAEEAARLSSADHQTVLALSVAAGFLSGMSGGGERTEPAP